MTYHLAILDDFVIGGSLDSVAADVANIRSAGLSLDSIKIVVDSRSGDVPTSSTPSLRGR